MDHNFREIQSTLYRKTDTWEQCNMENVCVGGRLILCNFHHHIWFSCQTIWRFLTTSRKMVQKGTLRLFKDAKCIIWSGTALYLILSYHNLKSLLQQYDQFSESEKMQLVDTSPTQGAISQFYRFVASFLLKLDTIFCPYSVHL